MENPFTLTFGKEPINRIDRTLQKDEIIEGFEGEHPSNQVCMITGVRGTGKTVLLTEIGKYFADRADWIVIDLTPERDLLSSFASELYNYQGMAEIFRRAKLNFSVLGMGVEIDGVEPVTDLNVAIRRMLQHIGKQNKKVLVTIDEAVCNPTMKEFASVFQIYMRQELPVYLILCGLYERIYELQNEDTLTFLYRAPKVELQPLNIGRIADRYRQIFSLTGDDAMAMAKATKGYSFAFQVLGYLSWKRNAHWTEVRPEFRQYLEDYVYQKLWTEISAKDKEVIAGIIHARDHRVSSIRDFLGMSSGLFGVYRGRLMKKGIIAAPDYGRVEFTLPEFEAFAELMTAEQYNI